MSDKGEAGAGSLEGVFDTYASFGQTGMQRVDTMDSKNFAKFTRDCGILDKKVTAATVDLVFTQVKGKTERKITYDQFLLGVEKLASKKYPDSEAGEALEALTAVILDKAASGPSATSAAKPKAKAKASPAAKRASAGKASPKAKAKSAAKKSSGGGSIFDRLTDTSQYTGAHKERFDADGKGKGAAGRDRVAVGKGSNNTQGLAGQVRK